MSNQQYPAAKIKGLKGPFFPKNLTALQSVYSAWDVRNYNALRLAAECAKLHMNAPVSPYCSFTFVRGPYHEQTADGYSWKAAFDFKIVRNGFQLGALTVLLPHCCDGHLLEGTYTDRSIAVYTTDKVEEACLEHFVQLFAEGFTSMTHVAAA